MLLSFAPKSVTGEGANVERRTLFFNLSGPQGLSLDAAGKAASYFLTVGGRTYSLPLVSENPGVLAKARKGNAFLSAVPEQQITHYLEDVALPTDITPLAYIGSPLDQQAGTWKMVSIVQMLSPAGMSEAFTNKLKGSSSDDPVPVSAKRDFYGMASAFSKQDMLDELALVDYTDAARTLIALHPDMVCANPAGAAYIAAQYVSTNAATRFLAHELRDLGPASPQASPQKQNDQGWATLIPINQPNGSPFKMDDGKNQYFPDWNKDVDEVVAGALTALLPRVKDDARLGSDITDLPIDPNARLTAAIQGELTGKLWYRHDGMAAIDHGSAGSLNLPVTMDFRQKNGETGLAVTRPRIGLSPTGGVQITFDNVANWFLRFLSVYFQFRDPGGNVIHKTDLPPGVLPNASSIFKTLDRDNALFAGIIPPVFSVAGIPIYPPGEGSFVVNLPNSATTINAFYTGLGLSGSQYDPTQLTDVGKALTLAVNFGMVAFFMAVGDSDLSGLVKAIAEVADIIASQLVNALGTILNSSPFDKTAVLNIGLTLFQSLLGLAASKLRDLILTKVALAQFRAAFPIAGQIMRAFAVIIGASQLIVAGIEARISPPIYQFDLTFTHEPSINIKPDPNKGTFPQVASNEVLYYKVDYVIKNGSAHFLDHVQVPNPNVSSIPVILRGIPLGGKVTVSVGFYIREKSTAPSENDMCASMGTTGEVDNIVQPPLSIVLQDVQIPIGPKTTYIHKSKIVLDAPGKHRWLDTLVPPPYVPPSIGLEPGDIGAFRSITVRQSTQKNKGYVGYSWQSYSRGVPACQGNARNQLDMAANLNTNQTNAQDGYTVTACGLQGGLILSYNLISDPSANFYLDRSLMLRQVKLDPPDFSNLSSGQSYGKLNLPSTMLLLHPAGYAVSINNANSLLEALHLPETTLDDSTAAQQFLARTYSGPGSRPGLMKAPVAACVTAEGAILVLEAGNNRIQAFDLGGNPLRYFTGQKNPYFLELTATRGLNYSDVAAEFSGYIYVLSRKPNPVAPSDFRLDIYHPAQSDTKPICTTTGMTAARLTVDYWRNVYTLNYEALRLPPSGSPPGPPPGPIPDLTEPSVSFWLPRNK